MEIAKLLNRDMIILITTFLLSLFFFNSLEIYYVIDSLLLKPRTYAYVSTQFAALFYPIIVYLALSMPHYIHNKLLRYSILSVLILIYFYLFNPFDFNMHPIKTIIIILLFVVNIALDIFIGCYLDGKQLNTKVELKYLNIDLMIKLVLVVLIILTSIAHFSILP